MFAACEGRCKQGNDLPSVVTGLLLCHLPKAIHEARDYTAGVQKNYRCAAFSNPTIMDRGNEIHENTDGPDISRSIRQHWAQNGFLARGIRRTVLCLQRRWSGPDTGFAKRWTTTDRSQERFTGKSDPRDGTVQKR